MNKRKLPVNDRTGYYEIRLESIGGLGANLCGKMLGELGVRYLNINSMSFSSYGSEKTGTPVKGYIRYCEKNKEIRVHSAVIHPDLLVLFHQELLSDKTVWEGCNQNTEVIIGVNRGQEPSGAFPVPIKRYHTVFAQEIAMEAHSRINMVMLGAIAKVLGFIKLEEAVQICKDTLGGKYPEALSGNLEGIRRGYDEVTLSEIKGGEESHCMRNVDTDGPEWGYVTAPKGGINLRLGNTVVTDLSPARQGYFPIFIKEKCINCGLCDTTCPDMVFQFVKGQYQGKEMMVNKGLDYYHCKGCLRCVDICPVNALVSGVDAEHPKKNFFMANKDLLRNPNYYIKAGADGYITSEAYLTEKRMEGGEV